MSESDPSTTTAGPHGPGHVGCATCEAAGGAPAGRATGLRVTRVAARGEQFKVVQLVGNLFVCSRANGNCCCGWAEKGRMTFENDLWSGEWERRRLRNRVHLTFTGCLGPCVVGNNALLQLFGRSVWFKDLNEPQFARLVFDYIETCVAAGAIVDPPAALRAHVYERYVGAFDRDEPLGLPDPDAPLEDDDLAAGLDPVCLMDVDPLTARFTADHAGRTYAFCGPGCRREFVEDPDGFVGPGRAAAG